MSPGRSRRRLKVLHLAGGREWCGAQMQDLALTAGLRSKGHDPMLAAPAGSELARRASDRGLGVAELPGGRLSRTLALRRLLAPGGWDAVRLSDAADLRALARAELMLPKAACVMAISGEVAYGSRVLPGRLPLARVSQFWAASEWVWSALVRGGIDEERIAVIPTGIDLDRFALAPEAALVLREQARRDLGIAPEAFVVGTVLRLAAGKGVEQLVEAGRLIRDGVPPPGEPRLKVLVVGGGPHRAAIERHAARLGMSGDLVLTGHREDVPALMASMDVYVHPAPSGNSFPEALREAMAMAVPAVATDLMGIREIIDNGKQGLVAPPGDAGGLARSIMRLWRDPEFARGIGRAGCLKVQRYGLRATIDRAEELYFRLIR